MPEHGRFVWNELNTRDAERAKRFYGSAIGWSFDAMPMGPDATYWLAKSGGESAAGIFTMAGPGFEGVPEHWLSYLEVDDVDGRAARVREHGGTVLREPWSIPGVGRCAIVRDPGGAVMGWITSAQQQAG
jgi:predicted enzyme related to lactoylglutathione lyase